MFETDGRLRKVDAGIRNEAEIALESLNADQAVRKESNACASFRALPQRPHRTIVASTTTAYEYTECFNF